MVRETGLMAAEYTNNSEKYQHFIITPGSKRSTVPEVG